MNKRQRKKQYIKTFSKAYDESMKHAWMKRNFSISTFTDARGAASVFISLNKGMSATFDVYDYPELTIEALLLHQKVIKR